MGGFPDEVVPLMVEGRIEEKALVLELEVLVLLANSALAKREQLLTLGESADGYSPFLESDWHLELVPGEVVCVYRGPGARVLAALDVRPPEGKHVREARAKYQTIGA